MTVTGLLLQEYGVTVTGLLLQEYGYHGPATCKDIAFFLCGPCHNVFNP